MFNKKIDIQKIKDEAYLQGLEFGYANAKKEFDEMVNKRAMDLYTQQNWLVNPNHVFQVTKTGIPFLNQDPINKAKLKELKQQAKTLQGLELWDILTTLIRTKAIELAVKTSQNWENVTGGKMMVHNIALMESVVQYLANVDLSTIPDTVGGKERNVI